MALALGLAEARDEVLSNYPQLTMQEIARMIGNGRAAPHGEHGFGRYSVRMLIDGKDRELVYAKTGINEYHAVADLTEDEKIDLPPGLEEKVEEPAIGLVRRLTDADFEIAERVLGLRFEPS